MRLFDRIRSRSRSQQRDRNDVLNHPEVAIVPLPRPARIVFPKRFPDDLLEEIFTYVCPHTADESYKTCEESGIDGGCSICDRGDLFNCASVDKQWKRIARRLLFRHVRFDNVHFCGRGEDTFRSRRSRAHYNTPRQGNAGDAVQDRLVLFNEVIRAKQGLAERVLSVRSSYMIRESCQADFARVVSVTPNLRYIDLPDGIYSDNPEAEVLRHEVQARCPDIRSMRFKEGAEKSLRSLSSAGIWRNLESVRLNGLMMDPRSLTASLSSLPNLTQVDLLSCPLLDDTTVSSLPPLSKLSIQNASTISVTGLVAYLSQRHASERLTSLSLTSTGIRPEDLHLILTHATKLRHLLINRRISRPFPLDTTPLLSSQSLRSIRFEVTSQTTSTPSIRGPTTDGHYAYLADSIQQNHLPNLQSVYALSMSFSELLALPAMPTKAASTMCAHPATSRSSPPPPYTNKQQAPMSTLANLSIPSPPPLSSPPAAGVVHPLRVFTKSIPELEWQLSIFHPEESNPAQSTTNTARFAAPRSKPRPASLVLAPPPSSSNQHAGAGGTGRDSVLVKDGFGGYLSVPGKGSEAVAGGKPESPGRGFFGVGGGRRPKLSGKGESDEWMG